MVFLCFRAEVGGGFVGGGFRPRRLVSFMIVGHVVLTGRVRVGGGGSVGPRWAGVCFATHRQMKVLAWQPTGTDEASPLGVVSFFCEKPSYLSINCQDI